MVTKQQMAQALIDLHNCLPYSSEDKYNEMPEDAEPFEYVQELYENLLVELWEIANRFPPNSLEAGLRPVFHPTEQAVQLAKNEH